MPIIPINQLPESDNKTSSSSIIPIDQLPEKDSLFTESNIQPQGVPQPSPLNAVQHAILSFSPDTNTKLRYLSEKFSGSNISQDEKGNIVVDGRRINPEGFQFGPDVAGNLGSALPIIGQIAGGAIGSPAGPAGTIAGGVAGASSGQAARIGIGSMVGLKPEIGPSAQSVAGEGALALGGELATRGAFIGGKFVAKATGVDKVVANAWRETMNRLGKFAPEIAEFVGGVDKEAVKVAQKHGFNNTFTPENFAEDKMQRIVKNILFQDENIDLLKLGATTPELNGVQTGATFLAKSIKSIDDGAYDSIVKRYSGLSDETISTIKGNDIKDIFSKSNLDNDKAIRLSNQFEQMVQTRIKELGQDLSKAESKAISESKFKTMAVDDLGKKLNSIISEVRGNIRVPEFTSTKQYRIPGMNELVAMRNALGGYVKDDLGNQKFRFFGETITSRGGQIQKVLERPSLKQLSKRLGAIDNIADALYANKNVSAKVKVAARDWLREIRGRYDEILGIGEKSSIYSAFKDVATQANIDRASFLASFEGQIKNFRKISGAQRNVFNTVLENLNPNHTKSLLKEIDLLNAADELRKVDTIGAVSKLQGQLNNKSIISSIKDANTDELFLRQADGLLKNSNNHKARKISFMDDAEKSLASKEFLKGSPNLLRIGALTSMIGGFKLGGPVGAVAGIAISQPRNIARVLSSLERGVVLPQSVQKGLQTATQVSPALASQTLAQLLSQKSQTGKRQ